MVADFVIFLALTGLIVMVLFGHRQSADGRWHPHGFRKMRRKGSKGWEHRPMTSEEEWEDWDARQF